MKYLLFIITSCFLFSTCNLKEDAPTSNDSEVKTDNFNESHNLSEEDTMIYDCLNQLLTQLNITAEADMATQTVYFDSSYLNSALKENNKFKRNLSKTYVKSLNTSSISSYLNEKDIKYMTEQIILNKDFVWDIKRVGLKPATNLSKTWKVFSVPLFSLDHNIALLKVSYMCREFCCSFEEEIILLKVKNKWKIVWKSI